MVMNTCTNSDICLYDRGEEEKNKREVESAY